MLLHEGQGIGSRGPQPAVKSHVAVALLLRLSKGKKGLNFIIPTKKEVFNFIIPAQ